MEDRKKRGTYKIKEINKVKLMSYYKEINNGKLDKLDKIKEDK